MAPSPSADASLSAADAEVLLDIADGAIVEGLLGTPPSPPPLAHVPEALHERVGVFVTVRVDGELNGCIGSVRGTEPLAHATARHAWAAAFADPRLPALRSTDYSRTAIEVSVLSPLAPLEAGSREQLLAQLRPGTDGLVLALGARQGLFLPAVWDRLGDPELFLDHLQVKAGLPPGWWHPAIAAWRFTATKFVRESGEPSMSPHAA